MKEAPALTTPRLLLRPHKREDAEAIYALWNEPTVYAHITGKPSTREECWARLLRYSGLWPLLGYGYWAIEDRETKAYVGEAGLADFHRMIEPSFGDTPEMGWLVSPQWQGQGLAREALEAIIEWAKAHIASPDIACMIAPENGPSLKLAARIGFIETGRTSYKGDPTILFRRKLRG